MELRLGRPGRPRVVDCVSRRHLARRRPPPPSLRRGRAGSSSSAFHPQVQHHCRDQRQRNSHGINDSPGNEEHAYRERRVARPWASRRVANPEVMSRPDERWRPVIPARPGAIAKSPVDVTCDLSRIGVGESFATASKMVPSKLASPMSGDLRSHWRHHDPQRTLSACTTLASC